MASAIVRRMGIAAGAALTARAVAARLEAHPVGPPGVWLRTNHRGASVSLTAGPAFVTGAVATVLAVPGIPGRVRLAAVLAGLGAGAVGRYDDIAGRTAAKGFAGHFSALRHGELTTGVVKVAGIGGASLAAALVGVRGAATDKVLAGAVIAGAANLANLLDLRPGRALKAGLVVSAPMFAVAGPAGALAAAAAGAASGVLPCDLAERTMLGDCGANALGALCGLTVCLASGRGGRWAALIGLAALNAASERISFSRVIAANPVLRRLDEWGRAVAASPEPDAAVRAGSP